MWRRSNKRKRRIHSATFVANEHDRAGPNWECRKLIPKEYQHQITVEYVNGGRVRYIFLVYNMWVLCWQTMRHITTAGHQHIACEYEKSKQEKQALAFQKFYSYTYRHQHQHSHHICDNHNAIRRHHHSNYLQLLHGRCELSSKTGKCHVRPFSMSRFISATDTIPNTKLDSPKNAKRKRMRHIWLLNSHWTSQLRLKSAAACSWCELMHFPFQWRYSNDDSKRRCIIHSAANRSCDTTNAWNWKEYENNKNKIRSCARERQ